MFLTISEEYTNSYSSVNAKPYSTDGNAQTHNSSMEFRDWLQAQIAEIGIDPTALSRLEEGLNQPTIQRVLSGETPNPRLKTTEKIKAAVIKARQMAGLSPSPDTTSAFKPEEFDSNVTSVPFGKRPIPVISYVQAGLLTDINDPYAPGDGFAIEICEDDLGRFAFALEIEGDSMLPEFRPGDRVIIDPDVNPMPGDFVVAKNSHQKATFKKFRPRGMNEQGAQVFELVPLNEDYPTMRSDIEQLRIIGTMVEHRKKYRRKA